MPKPVTSPNHHSDSDSDSEHDVVVSTTSSKSNGEDVLRLTVEVLPEVTDVTFRVHATAGTHVICEVKELVVD